MDISESKIDELLEILESNYRNDETYILTEADATNRFYEILSKNLSPKKNGISIHSELRPFIKQKNGKYRIIKKGKWTNEGRINEGAKFDLSIINNSDCYWKQAFKKVAKAQTKDETKVKYWRFLSYPLEAFKAVFEFKIRVQGNIRDSKKNRRGISKDIEKLDVLHSRNKGCLKYLVILDRKITERNYHKIKKILSDKSHIKHKIFPEVSKCEREGTIQVYTDANPKIAIFAIEKTEKQVSLERRFDLYVIENECTELFEADAVRIALTHLPRNSNVILYCDKEGDLEAINNGKSKNAYLQTIIDKIKNIENEKKLSVEYRSIPRKQNYAGRILDKIQ